MSDLNVRLKITTDTAQAEKSLMTAAQRTKAWQQATDSLSQSSSLATQALQQNTQALDKNGKHIHAADAALGRFVDTQGKMREANGRFVRGISEGEKALSRLDPWAASAASSVNYFGMSMGGAGAMVSASVVAMGAMVAAATNDLLRMNRELSYMTATLDMSKEALQVWQVASSTVGFQGEKMSDIFKDISDKLGDFAATGGGEAVEIMKRLKLDVKDLIQLSPDKALLKIVEAMDKTKNISQQEKIFLLEALANDSSRLLPLLENNAEELRKIEQLANGHGVILDAKQSEVLDAANKKMGEISLATQGLSHVLGMVGADLLNAFGDDVVAAIVAVKQAIEVTTDYIKSQASETYRAEKASQLHAAALEAAKRAALKYIDGSKVVREELRKERNAALEAAGAQIKLAQTRLASAKVQLRTMEALANAKGGGIKDGFSVASSEVNLEAHRKNIKEQTRLLNASIKSMREQVNVFSTFGKSAKEVKSVVGSLASPRDALSVLDKPSSKKNKGVRTNSKAIADALKDEGQATKKLKNSKKELKSEREKLLEVQQKELDSLRDIYQRLTMSELGYYAATLKIKKFDESVRSAAMGLKYQNILLEEQKKLTAEGVSLSPNIAARFAFDLGQRGLEQGDIDQLVGQKIGIEQEKFVAGLNEQVAKLSLSDEAFKRSTWAAQGFSESQIEARLALESKIRGLEKHKEQLEENKKKLEAIEEAYSGEKAALLASKIEIEQGSDALYRHQLKLKGVSEVRQNELLALRQQNEAYEKQQQYLDKVNDRLAALKLEREKIGKNAKAIFEIDLKAEGFESSDIASLTQEKMAGEFEKVKQALQEQRQQLILTAKDYRNLGLELDGFDAKQRAFIAGFEMQNARISAWQDAANTAFDNIGKNLTQVALTGKADWKGMIDELIRATFELTIIQPFIESLKASFAGTGYSGGGVGGFFSSLVGGLFADGGAFAGGQQVHAFANGGAFTNAIVNQPTPFAFGGGSLGVMGEAGAEAIMPLQRDASGVLGVRGEILAQASPVTVVMPPLNVGGSKRDIAQSERSLPPVSVTIKNLGGKVSKAEVESVRHDSSGGIDIQVVVDAVESKVVEGMKNNSSKLGRTLDGRYVRSAR